MSSVPNRTLQVGLCKNLPNSRKDMINIEWNFYIVPELNPFLAAKIMLISYNFILPSRHENCIFGFLRHSFDHF